MNGVSQQSFVHWQALQEAMHLNFINIVCQMFVYLHFVQVDIFQPLVSLTCQCSSLPVAMVRCQTMVLYVLTSEPVTTSMHRQVYDYSIAKNIIMEHHVIPMHRNFSLASYNGQAVFKG